MIVDAMERANLVPNWQQDLNYKLIKLNEVNWKNWNLTDTVQTVYDFLGYSPNIDIKK